MTLPWPQWLFALAAALTKPAHSDVIAALRGLSRRLGALRASLAAALAAARAPQPPLLHPPPPQQQEVLAAGAGQGHGAAPGARAAGVASVRTGSAVGGRGPGRGPVPDAPAGRGQQLAGEGEEALSERLGRLNALAVVAGGYFGQDERLLRLVADLDMP
jgi:hypothetical protein